MTTKSNTKPELTKEEELAMLRARLAELEGASAATAEIKQDEYIPVMSLLPFALNLTTREGGQGSVKRFAKFGEIKNILYRDLLDIIEVNKNFLEAGYFYIMHPRFVRQNGLDDIYSKILTKEKIEEVLETNPKTCVDLYTSANEKQQEIIVQLLIDKIKANPDSVNLNVVDRISRLAKKDISKLAEGSQTEEIE